MNQRRTLFASLAFLILTFNPGSGFASQGRELPQSDAAPPARREVAITIDDLPMAGGVYDLAGLRTATKKLLAPLVKHRVPAVGFVNEGNLYVTGEVDARIDVLRMWLDAGMTLGNHTFSHASFSRTPLQQFMDEVIHGEVVTRRLMKEKGLSKLYFRFPFNNTGATKETKEAMQAFLKSRGYEVAPFTVEHEDYVFDPVYRKAKQRKDEALMQRIRAAYLAHLDTKFDYYERRSQMLLGREVKQIFLIHVNEINADTMDETIAKLKRRGYSFITLEQALQDKAYQIKDEYVGDTGISWLHRWMIALGKELNYRDDPDPPKFINDLWRAQ
ncbi:MAG TPA: polysaccharide deacetylase family protein [Pyrinomonadaceae bacterium]|jgi:peptidoglycan/xylan/chitin deacetylase (PgdA/CDA1 family)